MAVGLPGLLCRQAYIYFSVQLDVRLANRRAPLRVLGLDELAEFLRTAAERRAAVLEELLLQLRGAERLVHLRVQLVHDRLRRARGRDEAAPRRRLEARIALLGDGGNVRVVAEA